MDVIVGNPPWGSAPKYNHQQGQWCNHFDWPIGDNELSQAFIARSLNLLKPDGEGGLLVSTEVFLKHNPQSENNRKFRQRWVGREILTLKMVVNFIHTCELFFQSSDAPFAVVHYQAKQAEIEHVINYWSSKRTEIIEERLAIVLHLSDIKRVRQIELLNNEQLWKTYWWGNHRDAALVKNILQLGDSIRELIDKRDGFSGTGFQRQNTI